MKKTLAIILSVVMMLSAWTVMASAGKGPLPADSVYGYDAAYICVDYPPADPDGSWEYVTIYSNSRSHNEAVPGATYNCASNILTLENVNLDDCELEINAMGDDFRLIVVGDCSVGTIVVYGSAWGGSLTVEGDGTLTVNKSKSFNYPFTFYSEDTQSFVKFGPNVTVTAYSNEINGITEYDGPVLFYSEENCYENASDVYRFADKTALSTVVSGIRSWTEEKEITGYCYGNDDTCWMGYRALNTNDPDGIYGVYIYPNPYGNSIYQVIKFIYDDAHSFYFEDTNYTEQNQNPLTRDVRFNEEDFKAAGFSLIEKSKFLCSWDVALAYHEEYDPWSGTWYAVDEDHWGYLLSNSNDPEGIYFLMLDDCTYTDESCNKIATIENGKIYKVYRDSKCYEYLIDESFTPISVTSLEGTGFTEVLDTEYESLESPHSYWTYHPTLATDSSGKQYGLEVYQYGDDNTEYEVYNLEPISGQKNSYFITENTEIDGATLTPVTETRNEGTYYHYYPGLTFTYKGNGQRFPDVPNGVWFHGAADYCASRGYINGYGNGNFGPNDALQRQDFVVILANIAGADLSKYTSCKLTDVNINAYYGKAVAWAVDKGIISGYQNGKFGVGDPITREQVATILYRYMGSPAVTDIDGKLAKFPDKGNISEFAKAPLAWAVENNIISGMQDGTVAPKGTAVRAQIASIIMRMDQNGMFNA